MKVGCGTEWSVTASCHGDRIAAIPAQGHLWGARDDSLQPGRSDVEGEAFVLHEIISTDSQYTKA